MADKPEEKKKEKKNPPPSAKTVKRRKKGKGPSGASKIPIGKVQPRPPSPP